MERKNPYIQSLAIELEPIGEFLFAGNNLRTIIRMSLFLFV